MELSQVRDLVSNWQPDTDSDSLLRARDEFLEFLAANPDGLHRRNRQGHVTASAFVIDEARQRAALVLHPIIGLWLQPGGHLEDEDDDIAAAARREITEELGLVVDLDPNPLRLDVHPVNCRLPGGGVGPSVHYDVTLLARVRPASLLPARPDPTAWFGLAAQMGPDRTLEGLRHAALRRISQN